MEETEQVKIAGSFVGAIPFLLAVATPAYAAESGRFVWPVLIMTVFLAVVVGILLYVLSEAKTKFKGGSITPSGTKTGMGSTRVMESISKLSGGGSGGKQRSEQITQLFNQELQRKVSEATEEMSKRYSKEIEDKEREVKVLSHEFEQVKQEFEQVNAEKKQTESLVRSMSDGLIVVNDKGEVQLLNDAAQNLLGAEGKDGITGQSLAESLGDEQLVSMLKGSSGDKERDIEFESGDDSTKKVVRASSAVIEDEFGQTVGMVSVLSDITARKESEEKIKASEARLRKIIEENADGQLVVDKSGIIKFGNRAAETLFGRKVDELLGQSCGFSVKAGERNELNLGEHGGKPCIVETHIVETQWEEADAYLVSLRDVTETVRMREELKSLSQSDDLTRLYNRRGFVALVEQQLEIAQETGKAPVMLYIDLDRMKWINDNLGHVEGDNALVEVAGILRDAFHSPNVIGRMGGDEFAVFCTEISSRGPSGLIDDLQEKVSTWNSLKADKYELSLSVGFSVYDFSNPCPIDQLMSKADNAMYEEKRTKHTRSGTG